MKNSKMTNVLLILAVVIVIIAISTFAYAKYSATKSGTATAVVADMICEMEVTGSSNTPTIIHPYCIVNLKNYKLSNNNEELVTETDVNFKIEVTAKEGNTLPEYYWKDNSDSTGRRIAESTALTGTLKNGVKEEKEYTIVFLNSGEGDIKAVDFNLVAVQAD